GMKWYQRFFRYLVAMEKGATEIQEKGDDNIPYPGSGGAYRTCWKWMLSGPIHPAPGLMSIAALRPREFGHGDFPLEFLQDRSSRYRDTAAQSSRGLILQRLANGNPDVDAVYRLTQELPLNFFNGSPVLRDSGVWCLFNSQNTIFRRDASLCCICRQ